jgi:hypothetical protein
MILLVGYGVPDDRLHHARSPRQVVERVDIDREGRHFAVSQVREHALVLHQVGKPENGAIGA